MPQGVLRRTWLESFSRQFENNEASMEAKVGDIANFDEETLVKDFGFITNSFTRLVEGVCYNNFLAATSFNPIFLD